MAVPHVSGFAALLMQQGITSPAAIEAAMKQFATDKGAAGRDDVSASASSILARRCAAWGSRDDATPLDDRAAMASAARPHVFASSRRLDPAAAQSQPRRQPSRAALKSAATACSG